MNAPGSIRRLTVDDASAAAGIHAVMHEPWDEAAWRRMLSDPSIFGYGAFGASSFAGVVLARIAADEVEVLTIAVATDGRRAGIGMRLVDTALAEARRRGAQQAFLEVAVDNSAAVDLYRKAGFSDTGRRRDYYRTEAGWVDALIMHRPLKLDDGTRHT